MRILGVDPGSRLTGFGCVDVLGRQLQAVVHGTLKLSDPNSKFIVPLEDRLLILYEGLSQVIQQYRPQIMAVEQVFFAKNALSALKLGQARGVVLVVGKLHGLEVVEYSPTQIKQAVAGHGQADKEQVARMVQLFVGRQKFATPDASDALALAICHAQGLNILTGRLVAAGPGQVAGRASGVSERTPAMRSSKRTFTMAECVSAQLLKKK